MVVGAEEMDALEASTRARSDFEQRFDSSVIEVVPAEASQKVIMALYRKLGEKGQSFSLNRNNLDYDSSRFIAQEWGGVLTVHGDEEDADTQLTVLLKNNGDILGYGAFVQQPDETEQVAFKIFPEARGTNSKQLFRDVAFSHLATSLNTPSELKIPVGQQFNPAVEGKPTAAPLFYRRLGFTTPTDSDLPSDLQEKLTAARNGKVEFSDGDKVTLSRHELSMKIDALGTSKGEIEKVKRSSIGNISPLEEGTNQLLAKVATHQTERPKVDRAGLQALREKLAGV